jgi:hypothetical protein
MEINWAVLVPSIFCVILLVVLIVVLVKHKSSNKDKITSLTIPYTTSTNSGLLTNVNVESYLVENDKISYLVIPGKGVQNAFSYTKPQTGTQTNDPSSLISESVEELVNYTVDNDVIMSEIEGYFNNCIQNLYAKWTLNNGILSCNPITFDFSKTNPVVDQSINISGCPVTPGTVIRIGFGASVIPLKKN